MATAAAAATATNAVATVWNGKLRQQQYSSNKLKTILLAGQRRSGNDTSDIYYSNNLWRSLQAVAGAVGLSRNITLLLDYIVAMMLYVANIHK